jgi:hypothetical protein
MERHLVEATKGFCLIARLERNPDLHHLISIFLTLLISLAGGDFAAAKNQASSASLGVLCASKFKKEFLTTDCTEYTDKSGLDRQAAKNAKVFKTSLEPLFRDSTRHYATNVTCFSGGQPPSCQLSPDENPIVPSKPGPSLPSLEMIGI